MPFIFFLTFKSSASDNYALFYICILKKLQRKRRQRMFICLIIEMCVAEIIDNRIPNKINFKILARPSRPKQTIL